MREGTAWVEPGLEEQLDDISAYLRRGRADAESDDED